MVPSKSRPEIVARIRAQGLTQQEIADTAGVNAATVSRDLANASSGVEAITNSRGQQRPATYARTEPDDDVIDAEIVEDDEPDHVDRETGAEELSSRSGTVPRRRCSCTPVPGYAGHC